MTTKLIDVVMPVYFTMNLDQIPAQLILYTREALCSIQGQTETPWSAGQKVVIVEDNGWNVGYLPYHFFDCKLFSHYIHSVSHKGIARCWNAGIEGTSSDVIMVANNDILIKSKDWDLYARREFELKPDLAVLFPSEVNKSGVCNPKVWHFGACFFIRREAWEELKGFPIPPEPGGQYEDAAMWELMKRHPKWKLGRTKHIRVYHQERGSQTLKRIAGFDKMKETNETWFRGFVAGLD